MYFLYLKVGTIIALFLIGHFNKHLSGFAYFPGQVWNETWPPPIHMSGVGHLEIPLPQGYQAKNWKIQLRWPHPMKSVTCFTDTVKEADCDGEG